MRQAFRTRNRKKSRDIKKQLSSNMTKTTTEIVVHHVEESKLSYLSMILSCDNDT